jgi:hypothetical protein
MWVDVANRYKNDSGVWFELMNEPYMRKATRDFPLKGIASVDEFPASGEYHWDIWSEIMNLWLTAIRDTAQASNIVIINGLDWAYSFGPDIGPIARPETYLPWTKKYQNVAYGFHPYQHGACCGQIGNTSDLSIDDPYQSAYCAYFSDGTTKGTASGTALPSGKTCGFNGYEPTKSRGMPPCHWVSKAKNPTTGSLGLCAGEREVCNVLTQAQCDAIDRASPAAGGWSKYVLPMNQHGPLIATEFGSFDCSSPFVTQLLAYAKANDISYTAWALWPQNSGGPNDLSLGFCGYPSVMKPFPDPGDFTACQNKATCLQNMQPSPWVGEVIYKDMTSH